MNLNIFIFQDILPYILYKNNNKYILDISLLNKSIFKIVQNLITYNQKQIKFYYPNILSFKRYINKSTTSKSNDDKYRLIKFKEIQELNIYSDDKDDESNSFFQILDHEKIGKLNDYLYQNLKNQLISICPNLKKVIFREYKLYGGDMRNDITDLSIGKFYEINNLIQYSDKNLTLSSSLNEFQSVIPCLTDEINLSKFEYSFQYLLKYSPKKINLSISPFSNEYKLILNYNNILLTNNSFKSLNFNNKDTPFPFIVLLINSNKKHIKSFTCRISNNSKFYDYLFYGGGGCGELDFSNNNQLKKLNFKRSLYLLKSDGSRLRNPIHLLELLKSNKSITKLGLELFDIKNSEFLSTLNKIKNISILQCNYYSYEAFLEHSSENSNIKILKVVLPDDNGNNHQNSEALLFERKQNVLNEFNKLPKNNKNFILQFK